jgi:hypothetical protein
MISLGTEPSLEVRSLISEQGLGGDGDGGKGYMCRERERAWGDCSFSFHLTFEGWGGTRVAH